MGAQDPLGELAVARGQAVGGAEDVVQGLAGNGSVPVELRALQLAEEARVVPAQRLAELEELGGRAVGGQVGECQSFAPGGFRRPQ
ncbi:hypothetical protein [Kitasatospora camelliae]|uniref:Uncharacterized protein n=1 Tax=Kitasatospora camelliae TaxID=3156397 RepID=A0AAU8K6C0_9ACTN